MNALYAYQMKGLTVERMAGGHEEILDCTLREACRMYGMIRIHKSYIVKAENSDGRMHDPHNGNMVVKFADTVLPVSRRRQCVIFNKIKPVQL